VRMQCEKVSAAVSASAGRLSRLHRRDHAASARSWA